MQPHIMATLGGFFALVYFACVIGIVIYAFILLGRFVSAHERVAGALEAVARKWHDETKP
jgi:hypothetical protein